MKKSSKSRVHVVTRKIGITKSPKFAEKGLATHACNVGFKCSHDCKYCSTGAMLRTHKVFKTLNEDPFDFGYAIVDPDTPDRVARDAERIKNRGMIQLSTIVDPYSPEAQKYDLGRRCLEAILNQPGWMVRILTKNAGVAKDFDLIRKYKDRVLVGLSITATPDKQDIISLVEPNASPISERMEAMQQAHKFGLRTYLMLCPLLPYADSPEQIDQLVRFGATCGVEEFFAEAVNPRGRGLILTQEVLDQNGYHAEAKAVEAIRNRTVWSSYVTKMIQNLQTSVRKHSDIKKLRVLLYPKNIQPKNEATIRQDDAGVVWL